VDGFSTEIWTLVAVMDGAGHGPDMIERNQASRRGWVWLAPNPVIDYPLSILLSEFDPEHAGGAFSGPIVVPVIDLGGGRVRNP